VDVGAVACWCRCGGSLVLRRVTARRVDGRHAHLYAGLETQHPFSPDGRKVAFVWNGEKENNEDIYVKQIGTAGPHSN